MTRPGKPKTKRNAEARGSDAVLEKLETIEAEIKSMADVMRKAARDIDAHVFLTGNSAKELEAVTNELRLIRSDLAAIEKRLPTAETQLTG